MTCDHSVTIVISSVVAKPRFSDLINGTRGRKLFIDEFWFQKVLIRII